MRKIPQKETELYRKVMQWYLSFIPLGIAVILFAFCFVFESTLWLYIICTTMFALFVVLFVNADKQIACKDGYTLVQALAFYRECEATGLAGNAREAELQKIEAIAQVHDYAKDLNTKQRIQMYKTGKLICSQMNRNGGKRNV